MGGGGGRGPGTTTLAPNMTRATGGLLELAGFRAGLDETYRLKRKSAAAGPDRKPWGYWKDISQIRASVISCRVVACRVGRSACLCFVMSGNLSLSVRVSMCRHVDGPRGEGADERGGGSFRPHTMDATSVPESPSEVI